jgi:hypothetical protein
MVLAFGVAECAKLSLKNFSAKQLEPSCRHLRLSPVIVALEQGVRITG